MAHLTYSDGTNQERAVGIDSMMPEVVIGRNPDCTIHIGVPSISRRHARVVFNSASGECTVEDLGIIPRIFEALGASLYCGANDR